MKHLSVSLSDVPSPVDALRLALAGCAIFFAIYLLTLPLGFHTNDDPTHVLVLRGLMGGDPSPFLVLHNIVLTGVLWGLVVAFPSLPWYTLHLVLSHFVAATGLLYLLLRVTPVRTAILVGVPLLFLFEGYFILQLQFTHAAAALLAVGFGLLLLRNEPVATRVVGLAMIFVGAMGRNEVVFLTVIVFVVPLVRAVFATRQRQWVFAAVGGCALLLLINTVVYRVNAGWHEHQQWIPLVQSLLGDLTGRDYSDKLAAALSEVGWTKTDWTLFVGWFHENPTVFEVRDLSVLDDRLLQPRSMMSALRMGWDQARQAFVGIGHAWSLGTLALVGLLAVGIPTRRQRIQELALIAAPAVLTIVALLVFARLPERVGLAIVYTLLVTILPVLVGSGSRMIPCGQVRAASVLSFVLVCFGVGLAVDLAGQNVAGRKEAAQIERALLAEPEALYLLIDWRYVEGVSPWRRHEARVRLLPSGTFARSPLVGDALERIGETRFIDALGTNPAIRIVANEDFLTLLQNHVEYHHGRILHYEERGRWQELRVVAVQLG